MTPQEIEIVDRAAAIWNKFLELPYQHADDVDDFRRAVHDMQRIVFARENRKTSSGFTQPSPGHGWSADAIVIPGANFSDSKNPNREFAESVVCKVLSAIPVRIVDTTTDSTFFKKPQERPFVESMIFQARNGKVPTMQNPPPPPPKKERVQVESIISQIPQPDTNISFDSYADDKPFYFPFWLRVLIWVLLAGIFILVCIELYKNWQQP